MWLKYTMQRVRSCLLKDAIMGLMETGIHLLLEIITENKKKNSYYNIKFIFIGKLCYSYQCDVLTN